MDLSNLSSNWRKLQTTLKKSRPVQSSPKSGDQNGLKRKREQLKINPVKSSSLPRKKPRTDKVMAPNGTVPKETASIGDLETSDNGVRPRPADHAASDRINAGLCTTSVQVSHQDFLAC